jgi:hypothetical protein
VKRQAEWKAMEARQWKQGEGGDEIRKSDSLDVALMEVRQKIQR